MTIQNLDSIELFLSYKLSRLEITNNTLKNYRFYIRTFVNWTTEIQLIDISADVIPTYRKILEEKYGVRKARERINVIIQYVDWVVKNRSGTLR